MMTATATDAFHELIMNFNVSTAVYNATANADENAEVSDALDAAIKAIEGTDEVATTYDSALAGMSLALEELQKFDSNQLPKPLIKGALAFFSQRRFVQVLDAQNILCGVKNLNEAIFMAAHGIGERRHMNAITSVADIIENKLIEADEILDAVRREI